MKKITLQKLVEAAEDCKKYIKKEKTIKGKELLSKAYAEITDIIIDVIESKEKIH